MSNRFALVLVTIIIIFGGFFVFNKHQASAPTNGGSSNASQGSKHIRGNASSKVTLTEYADFQCPACYAYHPVITEVYEKYKDQIAFEFVNFPLPQIHQHAMEAHRAAEAASVQGKFWEMYDLLYTNNPTWSTSTSATSIFDSYATQLGLDVTKFKTDFASSAVNSTINADVKRGDKLRVTGTPTFFINGKTIDNKPQTLEEFSKLIDEALKN